MATLLKHGEVADHDRACRGCQRTWNPVFGSHKGLVAKAESAVAEAAARAGKRTAEEEDELRRLCEQLTAAIERALTNDGRQTHAGRCHCLLLPPKRKWAEDGSSCRAVAARRLVQPDPDGRRRQAWRIKLTGSLVTLPSAMARFATCHADARAAVGDRSAMVFHKLQTRCAYNSCLCLNPWHVDVWAWALGVRENASRREQDAKDRVKAKDSGQDAGLAHEIANKEGEFPPTRTATKKRKRWLL